MVLEEESTDACARGRWEDFDKAKLAEDRQRFLNSQKERRRAKARCEEKKENPRSREDSDEERSIRSKTEWSDLEPEVR